MRPEETTIITPNAQTAQITLDSDSPIPSSPEKIPISLKVPKKVVSNYQTRSIRNSNSNLPLPQKKRSRSVLSNVTIERLVRSGFLGYGDGLEYENYVARLTKSKGRYNIETTISGISRTFKSFDLLTTHV